MYSNYDCKIRQEGDTEKCALIQLLLKFYVQPFALLGKRYVCTLLQQAISVSFTGLQQLI